MFIIIAISSVKLIFCAGMIVVLHAQSIEESRLTISVLISLFLIFDVLDGIVVEKWFLGKGARLRRLFDNITDVLVSHSVCILLLYALHWSMFWYIPLFIRDACLTWMAAVSLFKGRVVVFPGYAHKAAKGGLALAAVAMTWECYGMWALTVAYIFLCFTI